MNDLEHAQAATEPVPTPDKLEQRKRNRAAWTQLVSTLRRKPATATVHSTKLVLKPLGTTDMLFMYMNDPEETRNIVAMYVLENPVHGFNGDEICVDPTQMSGYTSIAIPENPTPATLLRAVFDDAAKRLVHLWATATVEPKATAAAEPNAQSVWDQALDLATTRPRLGAGLTFWRRGAFDRNCIQINGGKVTGSIEIGAFLPHVLVTIWNDGVQVDKFTADTSKVASGRAFLLAVAQRITKATVTAAAPQNMQLFQGLLETVKEQHLHVKRRGKIFEIRPGRRDPHTLVVETRIQADPDKPARSVSVALFHVDNMGDVRLGTGTICQCASKRELLDALLASASGSRSYLAPAPQRAQAAAEQDAPGSVTGWYNRLFESVAQKPGQKFDVPVTFKGVSSFVRVTAVHDGKIGSELRLTIDAYATSRPGPVTKRLDVFLGVLDDLCLQMKGRRYREFNDVCEAPTSASDILTKAIKYLLTECAYLYPRESK